GRPNVGKSTLFNRLVGKKLALVDDQPGVTRDLREGQARLGDLRFTVIDTAGLEDATDESLPGRMRKLTERAVDMADICLFMIDARVGVTPTDETLAGILRKRAEHVILVANKSEGRAGDGGAIEAWGLGLGEPVRLSAEHGEGMGDLLSLLMPLADGFSERAALEAAEVEIELSEEDADAGEDEESYRPPTAAKPLQVAVVGRPNAGKFAEVVVVLLDAAIPFEQQDLRIADLAEREGRAVIVAVNKWDVEEHKQEKLKGLIEAFERLLPQLRGAPLVTVSAKTGRGLDRLYDAIMRAHMIWNRRVSTARLNRWLTGMLEAHPPPAPAGRRIKLRYMTQAKTRPPGFVVMCSNPEKLPESYSRYLINGLRDDFDMPGTPIRLHMRSQADKNPYKARKKSGPSKLKKHL
ncbi:MAG: ribosome-associated GTPase EngA, partial [Rhodobacteraceae bacterium]|nr:ribosome-associated GTPase EngA [Paracoccaceae bacterium]